MKSTLHRAIARLAKIGAVSGVLLWWHVTLSAHTCPPNSCHWIIGSIHVCAGPGVCSSDSSGGWSCDCNGEGYCYWEFNPQCS